MEWKTPVRKGLEYSLENFNLTPKGDQSGCDLSFI